MKKIIFAFIFLLFLVGCTPTPPVQKECIANSDCVPATCCHATSCVPKALAPDCKGMFCTQECAVGTIDCGGSCACEATKCVAKNLWKE